MNAGILAPGYAPPQMPAPLLGQPQPVPTPYGRRGDPFWDNVSLLIRTNGLHGEPAYFDASRNSLAISRTGNARQSADRTLYSSTSVYTSGSSDSLSVSSSRIALGTGTFTIEAWILRLGNTGEGPFLGQSLLDSRSPDTSHAGYDLVLSRFGNTPRATVYFGTAGVVYAQGTTPITNGVWTHLAVTRSGSTARIWINGVQDASGSVSSLNNTNTTLRIATGANGSFFGHISELRVTAGVARYTSRFTPPTAPFPIGYQ